MLTTLLLQWSSWVFKTQERKRESNSPRNPLYRNFIETLLVETNQLVGSYSNVILTRQTCGQCSSKVAGSKRQAPASDFSVRMKYVFLISKCSRQRDLGLHQLLGLAERMTVRSSDFWQVFRPNMCIDLQSPLRSSILLAGPEIEGCSVLQCVAVCCSVMQCDAVWCSVLQCVAVCCSVLQCVAVCCSVLQHTLRAGPKNVHRPRFHCHPYVDLENIATSHELAICSWYHNKLQCVAVCCTFQLTLIYTGSDTLMQLRTNLLYVLDIKM